MEVVGHEAGSRGIDDPARVSYVTEFNLSSLRANVELAMMRKLLAKSIDVNVIMWKY